MTAFIAWGATALVASTLLLLIVLAVRGPVRRWVGPRLAYALWALPSIRLMVPPSPIDLLAATPLAGPAVARMSALFVGPREAFGFWRSVEPSFISDTVPSIWLMGASGLWLICIIRHFVVCRRLSSHGTDLGRRGTIRIIAADVAGPLAFGVFRRFIAVPRTFADDYDVGERDLALAHECAHHVRGDLLANWASIVVLAVHWWNPVAWIAIRAFRQDQELATDAQVLAASGPGVLATYAHVLAKAAGIGALPACNLHARSNLKGRLMMLGQNRRTRRQRAIGAITLAVFGGTALAATAMPSSAARTARGKQAVTIGVKPDGAGGYGLIIGQAVVAADQPMPGGAMLPADFTDSGGCDLTPAAKPFAMVIKGTGSTQSYTVMCASAAPAPVRATLAEGLRSLNVMRASIATQPATPSFPEAERPHALGAVDRSIREVEATLATPG